MPERPRRRHDQAPAIPDKQAKARRIRIGWSLLAAGRWRGGTPIPERDRADSSACVTVADQANWSLQSRAATFVRLPRRKAFHSRGAAALDVVTTSSRTRRVAITGMTLDNSSHRRRNNSSESIEKGWHPRLHPYNAGKLNGKSARIFRRRRKSKDKQHLATLHNTLGAWQRLRSQRLKEATGSSLFVDVIHNRGGKPRNHCRTPSRNSA